MLIAALQAQTPVVPQKAAPASTPSYRDLKFPPLRQVTIPEVAAFTLPNGMKVYLLENHELPTVRGTALVRTGNLFDPPDKIGLATMTGMVMRTGGTQALTGDQIDEKLENVAASVESQIGEISGSVSFSTLKENTDDVLAVFKDLLTGPELRQEKIDLAKTQLKGGISRRNDDPDGIASREFSEVVYGRDNPYGWRMEYEHVDRIQRADLQAFYRRYFFPANVMLAVHGDFSAAEMKGKLEILFAGWTAQQPPVPPFPAVKDKPAPGVYLAAKEDVTQTFFYLGHLGGVLRDKDYPALEVMADILGGGFRSRLFQKVRTQLGYAYNISADWGVYYDHPGTFTISGSTKSPSTTDTLKVIQQEVEKIRTAEVLADELEASKESVLNSFVFNFDTRAKTLNRMMTYEYHSYPKDFIFTYQKAIAAVTRADVLRVAKQYLKPENFAIVAVGKPQDFGKPLTEISKTVIPIDLTIPQPKKELAQADAGSLDKGKALLRKAQQAVGGADKLEAVKDYALTAEVQLDPSAGGMKVLQTARWLASNHFRQESQLPFGKIIAYSDGKSGWLLSPQGMMPLPPAQMKQVQGELFRVYYRLLLSDRVEGRTVNYAGKGVLEISDKQDNQAQLTLNEETGMPEKLSYQSAQMGGGPSVVEEVFKEFQEVSGLRVPSKFTIIQGGRKFAEVSVTDLKLNTGATVEEVSKRP